MVKTAAGSLSERLSERRRRVQLAEDRLKKDREALAQLQDEVALKIGRIAVKVGLADVELDDAQLTEGLKKLAAQFRGPGASAKPTPAASPADGSGGN